MNGRNLRHFEQLLEAEIARVLGAMEHFRDTADNSPAMSSCCTENFAARATACERMQREMSAAKKDGRYLHHLQEARGRIEDGSYGKCSVCEKEIKMERLEAVLHTTKCAQCKKDEEAQHYNGSYLGAEPGCCGPHCQ